MKHTSANGIENGYTIQNYSNLKKIFSFFLCLRHLASAHAAGSGEGVGTEAEKPHSAGARGTGAGGSDTCIDVGQGRALYFCATRRGLSSSFFFLS